jgi:membrane dipeptidase
VILCIEAGDAIGTDLGRLNEFYRLGVRMITLVHGTYQRSGDNQIGNDMRQHPYPDPPPNEGGPDQGLPDQGLTDFGHEVVARMNKLGMIIDVAHASAQTVFDIAACTRAPVIDSHTSPFPPSVTSRSGSRLRLYEEMAAIVDTGGVVCTWPYAFDGAAFDRLTFEDCGRIDRDVHWLITWCRGRVYRDSHWLITWCRAASPVFSCGSCSSDH